jgi:nicotinamidase-related amidase
MIAPRFKQRPVLIDIDTQRDLVIGNQLASIQRHRRILVNLHRVIAAARHNHTPIISTAQVYDPDHYDPGFCLAGTPGFKKLRYTVRKNCICYPASDSTDLPSNLLDRYSQAVFCKRCKDPFEEPRLDRLLTELKVGRYFLVGATAERAVKATAMGLLARGKKVTVLTDVVCTQNRAEADRALREMKSKGAVLAKATTLLGTSALRIVHACPCQRCKKLISTKVK